MDMDKERQIKVFDAKKVIGGITSPVWCDECEKEINENAYGWIFELIPADHGSVVELDSLVCSTACACKRYGISKKDSRHACFRKCFHCKREFDGEEVYRDEEGGEYCSIECAFSELDIVKINNIGK